MNVNKPKPKASLQFRSAIERRMSRTVAIFFASSSIIYMLTWLLQYENNIIIFIANVFAPALLILLGIVAILAEVYSRRSGRRPSPKELIVRYSMIASVLLPTVIGEFRSGAFASRHAAAAQGKHISVLDANLLGTVDLESEFYDMVEKLNPDVITLQELNPTVAKGILDRVGSRYPCQALQAQVGVYGMGVMAKYPCELTTPSNKLEGIGVPQMVELRLDDKNQLSVVNFHTIPPHTLIRNRPNDNEIQRLSNAIIEREKFMRALALEIHQRSNAGAILAGDLNATTRNRVYSIIRDLGFNDAWSVGDRLRGGTWPSPDSPFPSWLVRIDYIFHTPSMVAKTAQTLPEGYGSDHRGVFATFDLVPPTNSTVSDKRD